MGNCTRTKNKKEPMMFRDKALAGLALFAIFVVLILGGCHRQEISEEPLSPPVSFPSDEEISADVGLLIERISKAACLNDRETIFEVDATVREGEITLSGTTTEPQVKEALLAAMDEIPKAAVWDHILVLPAPELGENTWAIVNKPVINLGNAPGQSEDKNTVTQARMGDVMRALILKDGWYLVQMEDSYLGWVDPAHVSFYDSESLDDFWAHEVALIAAKMAETSETPGGETMFEKRLVQGSVLPLKSINGDFAELYLPDGNSAFVKASSIEIFSGRDCVFAEQKTVSNIIATAQQYIGLPYLWGGCTSYGFDCSGFTQFCFKMNGYNIRRDAHMQYEQGTPVKSIGNLKPGDLVFFETYAPGPSHVGIYLGDFRYIHAGGSAGVAVNSFSASHPDYSESLTSKFLEGRRIIP